MAGFYAEVERIVSIVQAKGLEVAMHYYGLELEIWRPDKSDSYSRVHGRNSGATALKIANFSGIIIGDDFFENTSSQSGIFQSAILLTDSKELVTGDEVRVKRDDGKMQAYKVVSQKGIGQTREVFTQYELSGIL